MVNSHVSLNSYNDHDALSGLGFLVENGHNTPDLPKSICKPQIIFQVVYFAI